MGLDRPTSRSSAFAALATAGVLALAGPASAIHRETPFLVNLSNTPGAVSRNPGPSHGLPTRVAFESTGDLLGNGSVGSEIFLYVLTPNDEDSGLLGQVTRFAGDSTDPASTQRANIVAFASSAQIVGPTNGVQQIYLWFRDGGQFAQMTRGVAPSANPDIDGLGRTLVFESDADLKNGGGVGVGRQVFVHDITGPVCDVLGCRIDQSKLLQLTSGAGTSSNARINADGNRVFFQSDAAVVGPSNGFSQIYMADLDNAALITQLTSGAGHSRHAVPEPTGNFIAFESEADLLGNGSSGRQIFVLDIERDWLRQVTYGPGESFAPSFGTSVGVSFISTGDLLGLGLGVGTGEHLYFWEPRVTSRIFQVTKDPGTVTANAEARGNFITFDSDEDLMRTGMTGRQVYSFNSEGRIPKSSIGKQIISFTPSGGVRLDIGVADLRGEAPIDIANGALTFPPFPVDGFGVFCLKQVENGAGMLSCSGGRPGGDLTMQQDHMTDDVDPMCATPGSCREGETCVRALQFHETTCPMCDQGVCLGGPNDGLGCLDDAFCNSAGCEPRGLCNGPVRVLRTGSYAAGGAEISVPVSVSLSLDAGIDGEFCSDDDEWVVRNDSIQVLELTTGSVAGAILDANAVPGSVLDSSSVLGALVGSTSGTLEGSPFDCDRLEQGNYQGTRLVGLMPLLDQATNPPGTTDLLLPIELVLRAGNPYQPCTGVQCRVLTYCANDQECSDDNVCNGVETCVSNSCAPGVPLACQDGDACNGTEACDPVFGCLAGAPVDCDDGAVCSVDSCTASGSCSHTFIPGCCVTDADCQDTNVCNGVETCVAGNCVPGLALVCDDGNACNGQETCDPSAGCQDGAAPTCDDGARCTFDSCDPGVGCSNTAVPGCCLTDADCRDNSICNGLETCNAGTCVPGSDLVCDDGDACNGVEACDPVQGCQEGTPPVCDDGAVCTLDTCDSALGCISTSVSGCCNVDLDCQDTDGCNGLETCVAGECIPGTPAACDDGNVCNGTETCTASGGCLLGVPPACTDDGIACTNDVCDPVLGCLHVPIPGCCVVDQDCQDTNVCNGLETCIAGDCFVGTPLICDDGDACNGTETCDPALGCVAAGGPSDPFSFEAIQCDFEAWTDAFLATDPAAFGNERKKNRVYRLVKRARRNFGLPPEAGDQLGRSKVRPRTALRQLKRFVRKIDRLTQRSIAVEAEVGPLVDMAEELIARVKNFGVNAPVP